MIATRLVKFYARVNMALLIASFIVYEMHGDLPWRNYPFIILPLISIGITYTILAVQQSVIAYQSDEPLRSRPVPFRWIAAIKYAGFSILVWYTVIDQFWDFPLQPEFKRILWTVVPLIHVWFTENYVAWSHPETSLARDIRQEATDVRQDERDVTQDTREKRLYRAEDH